MIDNREWLEADGLGGFASGTVSGPRTRRYHAILLAATNPPTGRVVLVNGLEVQANCNGNAVALTTQHYEPNIVHPDGHRSLESFTDEPWPTWTFRLPDGTRIRQELFIPHETSAVALRWTSDVVRSHRGAETPRPPKLNVRPLLSGRDYHALHHENPAFRFASDVEGERVVWRPYHGIPAVSAWHNGTFAPEAYWYRQFHYEQEAERGLDCTEDLASTGDLHFDLADGPAVCLFTAETPSAVAPKFGETSLHLVERLAAAERSRRQTFASRLERAADAYLVRRGSRKTVIAGYPWFADWGRDTFIALRGLCLATGRFADAGQILRDWAGTVSEGMLPNRFSDHGDEPEFNSVDASLWYVIAVHDYLTGAKSAGQHISADERTMLLATVDAILSGYAAGTRFGIIADNDGLLRAGVPGVQLTWMDAKLGDWIVTPRIGKPVEVQGLWINALSIGSRFSDKWRPLHNRARMAFAERFWNKQQGCLYDVVDVDLVPGRVDGTIRPNQIFAVGGLPECLLDDERARQVVDVVEQRLLTPLGLRSLDPASSDYRPHYQGGIRERDGAYHQGTVWPWLMGAFVNAWLRVRGDTEQARREAESRFLNPLIAHLDDAGLGHVSEIADADPPHTPRGCPFQAWSVGELLRVTQMLSSTSTQPDGRGRATQLPESGRREGTPRSLIPRIDDGSRPGPTALR